jgi:Flp pilus assembly pilin Flp
MKQLMNRVRSLVSGRALFRDERGLSTVEYVIILVLIAVLGIGVWRTFGEKLRAKIDYSTGEVEHIDDAP